MPEDQDPRRVVERFLAAVSDRDLPAEALLDVLHPEVVVVEHPNAVNPTGTVRDREAALAGHVAGRRLLAAQTFTVHELLASGDRVAVRATWRGRVADAVGPLPAGAELEAQIAAFATVVDGRVRRYETFDCYTPLPTAAAATAST
jgi:ketosteroid isomerase-like protein